MRDEGLNDEAYLVDVIYLASAPARRIDKLLSWKRKSASGRRS